MIGNVETAVAGRPIEEGGDPITALAHAPDHALAISAAAYLDRLLGELLSSRFQQLSAEEYTSLFEAGGGGNGILAQFSSKVLIGYAVGYLRRDQCGDLMLVDRIARMFAKSHVALTFASDRVRQSCMQFSRLGAKPSLHLPDFDARENYYQVILDFYVEMGMTMRGDLAWAT